MADYRTIFRLGQDTALKERCLGAIMVKAVIVANDPAATPEQKQFAHSVALHPEQFVAPLARVLSATPDMAEKAVVAALPNDQYSLDSSGVTEADIAQVCEECWLAISPPTPEPEA